MNSVVFPWVVEHLEFLLPFFLIPVRGGGLYVRMCVLHVHMITYSVGRFAGRVCELGGGFWSYAWGMLGGRLGGLEELVCGLISCARPLILVNMFRILG